MRVLFIAILLSVAAFGGCKSDNDGVSWGSKSTPTPQSGWSLPECIEAGNTLRELKDRCKWHPEACQTVGQLQTDINDNCR